MPEKQHAREVYKQTNQAAIDFSKSLYNYSFLPNGAASTALLASKIPGYTAPAGYGLQNGTLDILKD